MAAEIKAKFNIKVVERQFSIHEIIESSKEHRLLEMFGCSTFNPIRPIKRVCYKDTTLLLDRETGGKFHEGLNDMIFSVMAGDPNHPWITPFE